MEIIKTSNPYDVLEKYAIDNKIDINMLDFRVHKYDTIITNKEMCQKFLMHELNIFDDDKYFNDNFEIFQEYEIEIIRKEEHLIDFKIGSNVNHTKVIGTFSAFTYNERVSINDLVADIRHQINKKFIKAGFLLGIREFNFQEKIMKMLSAFANKQVTEANIILAKGIEPTAPIDSVVKYYYKEKNKNTDETKIDYSKRGFISGVSEGELLIEFVKPIKAINGKGMKGNVIKVSNDHLITEPSFRVSERIREVEDVESFKYYALVNGYVDYSGRDNLYDIKDSMSVQSVEFKTTGSIDSGVDQNITLNVEEEDYLKDAIGANLSIEVATVNVKGNVAQNSVVKAKEANIGGQTHSKSKIYADKITISTHRGYCEGDDIVIDKLEGGTVVGKIVRIKQATGGKVMAGKVCVDVLNTNTEFEVNELAVIKECKGENNKFLVTASKSPVISINLDRTLKGIAELKKRFLLIPKILETKKYLIDSNKESVAQIKERLEEMKRTNTTPPAIFLQKVKTYQNTVKEYNAMIEEIKEMKDKQKSLEDDLKIIQNKIFDAKVINLGTWANMNKITFKLLHPEVELSYNTKKDEKIYCLKLEKTVIDEKEGAKIVKLNLADVGDFSDNFSEDEK